MKIPEARRDGVRAAFRVAFGMSDVGEMRSISGGASGALIYRLAVRGRPYVLRLEPDRIALAHRRRGFACMCAAAEADVAPPVRYADPSTGVAIMDFIASRPLSGYPGGPARVVRELGTLTERVRRTPPFPLVGSYPDMIEEMLAALGRSSLFAPGQLRPHAEGLARIRAALPWDASLLVSSHNDPNPRNILFDGERLWLIDWELAFRNDPLVDVAILTTEFAETPELEDILLEAAFGRSPDRLLRARLRLVRLLTRLFYGCIVLDLSAGDPRFGQDTGLDAFTPATFRAAVADGILVSGAPQTAFAFGKMSLAAFADGLVAPGCVAALELVERT